MAKRITESFVQPSTRVSTTWTPPLLKSAFLQAESGHMWLLGELCDNLLADDRVETVFETRIGGLLGLPITFEASGDGRRRSRAVKALEAGEDWWAAFPENELQQFLTWGRLAGISFAQLVPNEHDGRFVPKLDPWHLKNTRYDWNQRQWFAKLEGGREEPIVAGDGRWIVYTPFGDFRPWANGLWRGLARWWLLKSFAEDDAGRRSEKSGTGVVESAEDSNPALRKEVATDLFEAARDAWITLPKGFKASLLESKETIAQNQGYIVETANTAISVAVLGQNLTTEVTQGSFAAAKVHNKVEIQRIRSDAETASTMLHDQALEWWAEFNFGDRKLAPWPKWQTDPPTDQKERAEALKTLSEALTGFNALGLAPDLEQIETEFGVKFTKIPKPEPVTPAPKPNAPPPEPDDDTPSPDAKRAPEARALASGFDTRAAAGFVEGQTYADALVDRGRQRGDEALSGFVGDLTTLIGGIDSLEGARAKLVSFYRDAQAPEQLAAMAEALFLMSQRAGVGAVQQDTPEVTFSDGNN